jgi:hypothetical protein
MVSALVPNGRFLDTWVSGPTESRGPLGVEIQSWFSSIYQTGQSSGFIAPGGGDPTADLRTWNSVLGAGEPYGPQAQAVADQLYTYHQGYGLPGEAAPLLLQSGWTDDLFGPEQSLRVYNQQRAISATAPVALQLGDLGHSRGSNKPNEDQALYDQASSFFDAWLRGIGSPPPAGSVSAYAQTCPWSAPAAGPYVASQWTSLPLGTFSFGSAAAQTVASTGGRAQLAAGFDPVNGTSDACKTVPAETDSGTAVYTAASPGLTLTGLPTVTATINTLGQYGELAMRLWDVLPDGTQRLISRGVFRLLDDEAGTVTAQLHGNRYTFAAGDTIKLELLGQDAPYYRASNGTFTVQASNLTVSLPTTGPWYNVINKASGLCVDAAGWETTNGTTVQQWTCGNQQHNQEWQFEPTGGGYTTVANRNAAAQNVVWDTTGGPGATADGVKIQLWAYGGGTNQQWQPVSLGNGYYEFVARHSGKCLDVPGASTTNGVQLQQWTCNGNPQQAFRLAQQP